MSPEQIHALTAIAAALKAVGALPVSEIMMLVIIGPWAGMAITSVFISSSMNKALKRGADASANQEKRFEAVVRMYESNVELVKDYNKMAGDLTGIITLSTRTLEGLVQKIDGNQWCPLARKGVGK